MERLVAGTGENALSGRLTRPPLGVLIPDQLLKWNPMPQLLMVCTDIRVVSAGHYMKVF